MLFHNANSFTARLKIPDYCKKYVKYFYFYTYCYHYLEYNSFFSEKQVVNLNYAFG